MIASLSFTTPTAQVSPQSMRLEKMPAREQRRMATWEPSLLWTARRLRVRADG
jgi:hypothetical protein